MKLILTMLLAFCATTAYAEEKVVLTKSNTLVFNQVFYDESVAQLLVKAKEMDSKMPAGVPLYLILNSPGGSIEAGIDGITALNSLKRPVHTVTMFAASMGFQTVQGLNGSRFITRQGTLMSHKARGGFSGEFPGQLDSRYSHYLKRLQTLDNDVVVRTKGKHTAKSYASLIENEYWCDGKDCVDQGFVDAVAAVSCDASLEGTYLYVEKFYFMGMNIELIDTYDNCPLNPSSLNFEVKINGLEMSQYIERQNDIASYSGGKATSTINIEKLVEGVNTRVAKRNTARNQREMAQKLKY